MCVCVTMCTSAEPTYLDGIGKNGFEGGDVGVDSLPSSSFGFFVASACCDGFGFGHGSRAEVRILMMIGMCWRRTAAQHSMNDVVRIGPRPANGKHHISPTTFFNYVEKDLIIMSWSKAQTQNKTHSHTLVNKS